MYGIDKIDQMPDAKPQGSSKTKRALATLGLMVAGFSFALAITCLLAPVIGPPFVHYHNAHSQGKISEGDAWLNGAVVIAAVATLSGLTTAIICRKQRKVRDLSIGVFSFGAVGIIAFILLLIMIAGILKD